MGVFHGIGVNASRYKAGKVSHIHHEDGSHLVGDLSELFGINDPGISAGSGHDHLGTMLLGQLPHLIKIDEPSNRVNPVRYEFIVYA